MIQRMRSRSVGEIFGTWWNAVKGVLTPLTFILCLMCVIFREEIPNHTMRKGLYTFSMQFISVQIVSCISVMLCILNISYSPVYYSRWNTGCVIWKYMKGYIYGPFPWALSLILYSFGVPWLIDMDIPVIAEMSGTVLDGQIMIVTSVVVYYVTFIMMTTFLDSLRPVIGFGRNTKLQFLRHIMFPDGDIKVSDMIYNITFDICCSTDMDGNFYDTNSGLWRYPIHECIDDAIYGSIIVCTKNVAEDIISEAKNLYPSVPGLRKNFVIIPREDISLKKYLITAYVKCIINGCSRIVILGDIDAMFNSCDNEFILESCESAYLYFTENKKVDGDIINLSEPDGYLNMLDILDDYFDIGQTECHSTEYASDINSPDVKCHGSTFCAVLMKRGNEQEEDA